MQLTKPVYLPHKSYGCFCILSGWPHFWGNKFPDFSLRFPAHFQTFPWGIPKRIIRWNTLKCYMDWFLSLICKNYIFKHFVKTVEPTSLKFCMIIEPITLHLEYTIAQVKYANFSYAHAQTFILLNGEMATVSTGFRKLKFWLWLLQTVFYLNQTGFWKIY